MAPPIQSAFAAVLLDPDRPPPPGLVAHHGGPVVRRLAVYRNNVTVGLIDALAARYPAVARIVGEEFFRAMARVFVRAHPPGHPLMMQFGSDFADFIAGFEPAVDLPYLADIARLEAARTRAYHAADAPPLDQAALAAIAPEQLPELGFRLHPSVEIIRSEHPIVTIWAMNAGEAEPGPIDDWSGEDALVARPALDVEVRRLPPGAAVFLATLAEGHHLGAAAAAAAHDPRFDLAAAFAVLIGAGLVTTVTFAEQTP